jgi:hypothetical protein
MIPDRIASIVVLPISERGSVRSILGSAQRLERDLDAGEDDPAEILSVRRDGVVGDGRAEVDDDARPAETVVCGDRVDEPVGPDLARVVVADRHTGADPRPDDAHLVTEVALRHLGPLGTQLRDGRGDDRGVELVEAHPAQFQQVAQRSAELVGGRLAHGREAPMLMQARALEGPEVRLGVADIHDQQHGE